MILSSMPTYFPSPRSPLHPLTHRVSVFPDPSGHFIYTCSSLIARYPELLCSTEVFEEFSSLTSDKLPEGKNYDLWFSRSP